MNPAPMNAAVVFGAFALWLPITLIAFRALGPRRATPILIVAGFVLLPRELWPPITLGPIAVNKRTVAGAWLLVAALVFDPKGLVWARPRWPDLAMIAFLLAPIASLAANRFEEWRASIEQLCRGAFEWGVPYLMARLYCGDRDGPRRIALAIVIGGLAMVPMLGFEMAAGPRYYLAKLVYGMNPEANMVERLGGWRPEGFLLHGIEASTWMALASTLAAWAWLRGVRFGLPGPGWLVPATLIVTTVACRGVYGYFSLAIGLATVAVMAPTRSRLPLIALACVPPAYILSRVSGAWDARGLVALAGRFGREGTVVYRLHAEDSYLKKLADHGPVFGFGGQNPGIYDWWAQRFLMPDGLWLNYLLYGGAVGLVAFASAFFLAPAAMGIALPMDRRGGDSPGALARGLVLFLLLHQLDCLHNMAFLSATPLIGGSIAGLFLARRWARVDVASPPEIAAGSRRLGPWLRVIIAVLVLAVVEMLGRMPRNSPAPIVAPNPDQEAR